MTPTYLKSPPSFFPAELNEDRHRQHQIFSPNTQASSSSSLSCHIFFNSSTQDQSGYYHHTGVQQPHNQQDQADNFASHGGSSDMENESADSALKFYVWMKEDRNENKTENNQVKWMSSKMRLMQKMKNSDQTGVHTPTSSEMKLEDQRQPSSPLETDNCSNSSSNNSNTPIRVCSDCNTTKTPLWRSGPRGPKSLCNACGIRQRKARRAMAAAAAAAANGTILPTDTALMKTKVQYKDKRSNNGHVAKFKKKCKIAASTPSHGRKKLCFEEFLISLRKNLAFHRVFPQDEKEAAILLMALSCGHVHG